MFVFTFVIIFVCHSVSADYYLHLSSNSPVIAGGTVTFKSVLKDDDDNDASGSFEFQWNDNSLPGHTKTTKTDSPFDSWNVTYSGYPPGPYEVQVIAYRYFFVYYREVTSNRLMFNLTDSLNGKLDVVQDNKTVQKYVSNNDPVTHEVVLKPSDMDYLNNSTSVVLTYWFIDCQYYGVTSDFKFPFKYNTTELQHKIEALVVAGYEPITTPAPSTTVQPTTTIFPTTKVVTTSKPVTTTTAIISTTTPVITTTTTIITPKTTDRLQSDKNMQVTSLHAIKKVYRRHIESNLDLLNMKLLPDKIVTFTGNVVDVSNKTFPFNNSFPFICGNTSVPLSMNNTYGYFSKVVTVKAPVASVAVTGNNWLQQGNMLTLNVNCKGSSPFKYCVMFYSGIYNITGNETCSNPLKDDSCEFSISRYYGAPGIHTIVVVISNDVAKHISPVTVTVYKVTKQAQLSVIVVPVVFSLMAVVLIVFGVAYYIQNRTRFVVEVADFNFGPQSMEYMTFRERLRDSLVNAFTRTSVSKPETDNSSRMWPPSHRYGSMT